jgi:hypothetical protein
MTDSELEHLWRAAWFAAQGDGFPSRMARRSLEASARQVGIPVPDEDEL